MMFTQSSLTRRTIGRVQPIREVPHRRMKTKRKVRRNRTRKMI
jgi:hypothetical protein